jgi:hypothetical protein
LLMMTLLMSTDCDRGTAGLPLPCGEREQAAIAAKPCPKSTRLPRALNIIAVAYFVSR